MPRRPPPTVVPLACLIVAGLMLGSAEISAEAPRAGRPTSEGKFVGSWARVEPGQQQALRIRRGADGRSWQLRLEWRTTAGFTIDTAWQERCEFVFRGHPGSIELIVDPRKSTDDRIVASWRRDQHGDRGSLLVETGEIVLYRSGVEGRTLVWVQDELTRRVTVAEPLYPDEANTEPKTSRQVYNFEKQSFRILEWDELYW